MNNSISIGEASNITGLSPKTIRFYEEIKLIAPAKRLENSYRSYSKEDLEILFLIKEAKSLGLSLKDIKDVVHLCISQGCKSANNFLKAKLPGYLKEIEVKIEELQNLQQKLIGLRKTSIGPKGRDCMICSKENC